MARGRKARLRAGGRAGGGKMRRTFPGTFGSHQEATETGDEGSDAARLASCSFSSGGAFDGSRVGRTPRLEREETLWACGYRLFCFVPHASCSWRRVSGCPRVGRFRLSGRERNDRDGGRGSTAGTPPHRERSHEKNFEFSPSFLCLVFRLFWVVSSNPGQLEVLVDGRCEMAAERKWGNLAPPQNRCPPPAVMTSDTGPPPRGTRSNSVKKASASTIDRVYTGR